MVHQNKPYGSVGLIFFALRPGKAGVRAPSGTRTARAGRPTSRLAKTPLRGVFRARESPRWCTKISPTEAWGLFFCITPRESRRSCTIGDENSSCRPSHVPAGKNAPAGRFLERGRVPNGAPKRSSAEWLGTFCCTIPFGAASAFAQALRFSARARRWNHPIKPSFTAGL